MKTYYLIIIFFILILLEPSCKSSQALISEAQATPKSECLDSMLIKTFTAANYKPIQADSLEITDIDQKSVVHETSQINIYLKDRKIDVNADIVTHTEKMAKVMSHVSGYIRSFDSCQDFKLFKELVDNNSIFQRNDTMLYLIDVITTHRFSGSNTIWIYTKTGF